MYHKYKTSFAKIDIVCKVVKGQRRVINGVELEFIILRARFHDHRSVSSVGKVFEGFYHMGMAAILVM